MQTKESSLTTGPLENVESLGKQIFKQRGDKSKIEEWARLVLNGTGEFFCRYEKLHLYEMDLDQKFE